MGDPFFDLANFSVNHELSDDQNEELLTAYFGALAEADVQALRLMRFMSDFREAMWGIVQQGLSRLDFDFAGYANEHFAERRQHGSRPPPFVELLEMKDRPARLASRGRRRSRRAAILYWLARVSSAGTTSAWSSEPT